MDGCGRSVRKFFGCTTPPRIVVIWDLTNAAPQLAERIREELQAKLLVTNGRRSYWLPEGVGIIHKK
jgi:hypothetical protein